MPGRSESVWCMRCMPTQLMAPPSLARLPKTVKRYSSGFGIRKPRWVRRRWYVRQIPTEADSQ